MTDQIDPVLAAEMQQLAAEAQQQDPHVRKLIEAGNERYGEEEFGRMVGQCVANVTKDAAAYGRLGREKLILGFNRAILGMDEPDALTSIEYLSEKEEDARRVAQMHSQRATYALTKVATARNPNGHTGNLGSVTPSYLRGNTEKLRDINDTDVCDSMTDKQFEREWNRTHKATDGWWIPPSYRR